MILPGTGLDRETARFIVEVILQDKEVKAEIAKQVRTETSTARNKYSQYDRSTFDELTSGDVNRQYRMALSGYDVYGHVIIGANQDTSNRNTMKKMKNKIRYGNRPENGYENRSGFNII